MEEFRYIESQQHVSVPLEELFMDLGERSQVEDIENFASVFYTAKRTGGDMNRVIQKEARKTSVACQPGRGGIQFTSSGRPTLPPGDAKYTNIESLHLRYPGDILVPGFSDRVCNDQCPLPQDKIIRAQG